jgi:glycosyltransferase involved in cell wall biosynthesis
MKVLHILNQLMPSGAETMLRLAAPYWLEEGLELSILATGEMVGAYAVELENAGYKIFHLPFSKTFKFGLNFLQLLKENNFDVVHIHTERAFFLYAIIAWSIGVKKIVKTIHSNFIFIGFTKFYRTIFRSFMRWIKVEQISISQSVFDTELKLYNNRTNIIKNWFDLDKFHPPTLLQRQEARSSLGIKDCSVILSIGNCAPTKRHELIIEALPFLKNKIPKILYIHIGEEDDSHSELKIAEHLSVSSNVIFLGYKNDIRPYLWAADVFIMPSRNEGFGIAALEAIACGVPTILTDVPGLSDWKSLDINSINYTDADPEQLANCILSTLQSPKYPTKDQLEMIKDLYGVKRGASEYLSLYTNYSFRS